MDTLASLLRAKFAGAVRGMQHHPPLPPSFLISFLPCRAVRFFLSYFLGKGAPGYIFTGLWKRLNR